MPRNPFGPIAAGVLTVFGLGYYFAPREQLDTEVSYTGLLSTETRRVLSAAVTSLRAQGKLCVYDYAGEVSVGITRSALLGLVEGRQELSVPAVVAYYVDLEQLDPGDVVFDVKARSVRVRLPRLELGDVALQPERARVTNGGLLTYSDDVVQDLAASNYLTARRAFIKQAQQGTLVAAAKAHAIADVETQFRLPLKAIGRNDIKVEAYFP